MYASDSLKVIISHLSIRVVNRIADGSCLFHLCSLLEFLAAWEKRPAYLTQLTYQWCSAVSEAAWNIGPSKIPTRNHYFLRLRPQDLFTGPWNSFTAESCFSGVTLSHDSTCPGDTSNHGHGHPQHPSLDIYPHLLSITLEIGFRRVALHDDNLTTNSGHISHYEWVLETAFSSGDDEVVADALCACAMGSDRPPAGLCTRHLAKRAETDIPFSPRLLQASVRVIEHIWHNELKVSGLDAARWLNCVNIDVDDMVDKGSWVRLLVEVIRSTGPESLSSHYWRLLDKLVISSDPYLGLESRDVGVMRSLEEAEDWEKFGVWIALVWLSLPSSSSRASIPESIEGIEQVTLKLLLRRPSALPRFEDLCAGALTSRSYMDCQPKDKLKQICDQARAEWLPLESPPP